MNSPAHDDALLAEWTIEIGDRLRRGDDVDLSEYETLAPELGQELRQLMPTIQLMAGLPADYGSSMTRLGDFQIVRVIGRGGMGIVYEAIQISLGRRVALKVLPGGAMLDERCLQRFQVEAQAAAALNHPHIVTVYATGLEEQIPFYAMPLIEGTNLAEWIKERRKFFESGGSSASDSRTTAFRRHVRVVARLGVQAAEAIEYAHSQGVLHRDIKPSNLLLDTSDRLWVTDFGLARFRSELDLTQTGDTLGTLRYASPEQALGKPTPLDGRGDIYAIGATLYELLTFRYAFEGGERAQLLWKIAEEQPTLPRRLDPRIPIDLETIVLTAMAKSPADRYASAADLAADLQRFLDDRPILARRPSVFAHVVHWSRRHRTLVSAALVGVVALIVAREVASRRYETQLREQNYELVAQTERANRHAKDAERQRQLVEHHLIATQLGAADRAIGERHFERAQEILEGIGADSDPDKAFPFAWRYLNNRARRELIRLPSRGNASFSISLDANNRFLAATHGGEGVVIWDLDKQVPKQVITRDLKASLWWSRINPSGRTVYASMLDHQMSLGAWDIESGILLSKHLILGSTCMLSRVDLAASGRRLCILRHIPEDRVALHVLDTTIETELKDCFELPGVDVVASGVSSTNLAVIDHGKLEVRNLENGTLLWSAQVVQEVATPLTMSPNGKTVASLIDPRTVVVWEGDTGLELDRCVFDTNVSSLLLGPDQILAIADSQDRLILRDFRSRQKLADLKLDDRLGDRRVRMFFSPDGTRLATQTSEFKASDLQPWTILNAQTGETIATMPTWDHGGSESVFTPDSRTLIVSGHESPRLWHFEPEPESLAFPGHKDEAWGAAFSPDRTLLATGSDDTDEDQTIKLWDPEHQKLIRGWYGGVGTVVSLAFSPDGRSLATAHLGDTENVRFWDVATGQRLATLNEDAKQVRSLAYSPDGRTLATGGKDRTIRVWDVESFQCLRRLEGHIDGVRRVAYSPDGKTLASVSLDLTVRLWDIVSGSVLNTASDTSKLHSVAYAPDGRSLATVGVDGVIILRDAVDLSIIRKIRGKPDELFDLCFSPDGRTIATGGISGRIHLWDAATGEELLELVGNKTQINRVLFSPDGLSVISCAHDGSVRIWSAVSTNPKFSAEVIPANSRTLR